LPDGIESPVESMRHPQGLTPVSRHQTARLLRCRDRSASTDTRSRVCSPSRLPRKRFTAPTISCAVCDRPQASAQSSTCPACHSPAPAPVRVHRILPYDFRRFAIRPSHRSGRASNTVIQNSDKENYFYGTGLTSFWCVLPASQNDRQFLHLSTASLVARSVGRATATPRLCFYKSISCRGAVGWTLAVVW
jgi:hypothetical protein